jgi:hypothetical protein
MTHNGRTAFADLAASPALPNEIDLDHIPNCSGTWSGLTPALGAT